MSLLSKVRVKIDEIYVASVFLCVCVGIAIADLVG